VEVVDGNNLLRPPVTYNGVPSTTSAASDSDDKSRILLYNEHYYPVFPKGSFPNRRPMPGRDYETFPIPKSAHDSPDPAPECCGISSQAPATDLMPPELPQQDPETDTWTIVSRPGSAKGSVGESWAGSRIEPVGIGRDNHERATASLRAKTSVEAIEDNGVLSAIPIVAGIGALGIGAIALGGLLWEHIRGRKSNKPSPPKSRLIEITSLADKISP